jgi:hypothetical protein
MKVHVISYFIEDGNAGITAIYKSKKKAIKHYTNCVLDTLDPDNNLTKREKDAIVAKAIKEGRHEYMGSGQGEMPWYELSEETVK